MELGKSRRNDLGTQQKDEIEKKKRITKGRENRKKGITEKKSGEGRNTAKKKQKGTQ